MSWLTELRNWHGISLCNDRFIETGTNHGTTLKYAMQAGFNELHSIEIDPELYARARAEFGAYPYVHLHLGCSVEILPTIINRARGTTFWLDAHVESRRVKETKLSDSWGECALLGELAVIFSEPWSTEPLVLIDDAHIFSDREVQDCATPDQWPTVAEILAHCPRGHEVIRHDDVLLLTSDTQLMHS